MKQAYVFDLDGTLTDSICDIGDSVNYLLAQRGLPLHTYEEYRTYMGMGIGVTLRKAMPGYDGLTLEEQAALRGAYTAHNEIHCLDKTRPYAGMSETLRALQERGAILGIFTNKPELLGKKIVAELFKEIQFAFILGSLEGASMKPNPGRVLAELKKLGIEPARTVFVGDSKPDIDTAKNGGMTSCGVSWGFMGPEEVKGADLIVSHPRELLDIP
ncbi:MAG: HAD-IA family hydrolase [Spirochaetaceae bacterium]|jgi:phosphoglycolate phosphatase|nr:HAD-IA family hydrolase [Spirochaetaceae bacterium]